MPIHIAQNGLFNLDLLTIEGIESTEDIDSGWFTFEVLHELLMRELLSAVSAVRLTEIFDSIFGSDNGKLTRFIYIRYRSSCLDNFELFSRKRPYITKYQNLILLLSLLFAF